jgi:hypothetical protein
MMFHGGRDIQGTASSLLWTDPHKGDFRNLLFQGFLGIQSPVVSQKFHFWLALEEGKDFSSQVGPYKIRNRIGFFDEILFEPIEYSG